MFIQKRCFKCKETISSRADISLADPWLNEILKNEKVNPNIRLALIPAIREDFIKLTSNGTTTSILEAGGNFFGVGCSCCAKGQYGLTGGTTAVTMTTGNRNTKGKIGPADVYLASPVVAAATAIAGKIARTREEK